MSELKACPFCGGRAEIRAVTPLQKSRNMYCGRFVMCMNCLTTSDNYASDREAAEHWNRRANHD